MSKSIALGGEVRRLLLAGVNRVADAVSVTLGPKGRNVLIQQAYGAPRITKDGVTVARAVELGPTSELLGSAEGRWGDRAGMVNMGAALVKGVASRTNSRAGDGTTTATVLARALYAGGVRLIDAGLERGALLRGVSRAVADARAAVLAASRPVGAEADVLSVATISANGDAAMGALIAEAIRKTGREGTVSITEGKTAADELTVEEGLSLDTGYASPYFVTNQKDSTCALADARVLVCGRRPTFKELVPILEEGLSKSAPLLLVAEDFDQEVLAALVVNKLRGGLQVCAVKAPGFGETKKAALEDLAALTGAAVVGDERGLQLEPAHLGVAKTVTAGRDSTVVLGAGGPALNTLLETLRGRLAKNPTEWEAEQLRARVARLSSGVGVLRVGGLSETQVGERRDRLVDALAATKAALADGIVPGGGLTLFRAGLSLRKALGEGVTIGDAAKVDSTPMSKDTSDDSQTCYAQRKGIELVAEAVSQPLRVICQNGGYDAGVVANELATRPAEVGFDARTGKYADLAASGVLDPTKVILATLDDASELAALMLTTDAAVFDAPPVPGSTPSEPSMY